MMRSMFTAVSSLRAHQLRMDVIGNNIANVNTVGYKGSRITFQEVFSQTLRVASAPQGGRGGLNPHQVGLGLRAGSMDTFHTRGAVETTDYQTDLMIAGDGFFIITDDPSFLNRSYTRAGNFALDYNGSLVTSEGYKVLGYMADENGNIKSTLEQIEISKATAFPARKTENVVFEGNLNSKTKNRTVDPNEIFVAKQHPNRPDITYYEVNPNYQDMVAQQSTIEVFDSLGAIHTIEIAFIKGEEGNIFDVIAFYREENGNVRIAGEGFDSGEITLIFDGNGKIVGDTQLIQLEIGEELLNGANPFSFSIDFSKLEMFANESNASATSRDGYKQGTLVDFGFTETGDVICAFDNGQRKVLARLAIADFKNSAGLQKAGNSTYKTTANSGEPIIGTPGQAGFATLFTQSLEMSNVDISREFTNMITTQRGFQANSRVITTSDEMLQELVNMKR